MVKAASDNLPKTSLEERVALSELSDAAGPGRTAGGHGQYAPSDARADETAAGSRHGTQEPAFPRQAADRTGRRGVRPAQTCARPTKDRPGQGCRPAQTVQAPPPEKGAARAAAGDHAPPQKPGVAERQKENSEVGAVETEEKKMMAEATNQQEKGGKSDTSGSSQQKSPQGLSDTGYSSEGEEALQTARETDTSFAKEPAGDSVARKERKKLHVLTEAAPGRRQHFDSVDDSSESEPSPQLQRRRRLSTTSSSSEDYKKDSPCSGDEEEFIRKQIMGMTADEEPSPSDEDSYVHEQIREQEQQREEEERKSEEKSASEKLQPLVRKGSIGQEDESTGHHLLPETEVPETKTASLEDRESLSEAEGMRHFKPIELNSKAAALERQATDDGDQEVESLTESPDDRSRGEGSSSVHASSFTPGTSPTSVSSLDEDSDSSPSRKRITSEGKHRKSRHRQHGQMLPTIEDSSEEEEMREEEDLLREQEMQREIDHQQGKKGKKSKRDKEELRAQRRREYPKTPPSNLSPIEDASPTEELRQAAEMEELHKSSCSDYSPSIESEPEGFETSLSPLAQKDDQLSTSTSAYSPTDEPPVTKDTTQKVLKSADEAYEELMQKAKTLEDPSIPFLT
ncbi:hypothetical protein ANANG_G00309230 [Anguilla anguilla]|uniref:Piccolo presynaptic cytomatrix protein n=1 Tax=Anguilla anguilla TaxID=7936 RepID=A0A9D3RHN3_ANGAN|nr:hypothetical protein ANANG_G00309230 [Anguilla anguilla]